MKRNRKGFTLIELLVVIAIIGILATIVMVSLNTARQKARDSRRISDARQVQVAAPMDYDANTTYPATLAVMVPTYLGGTPTDPGSTAYVYDSTGCTPAASYVFRATLESTNTALNSDLDGTVCTDTACDDATFQYCVGP